MLVTFIRSRVIQKSARLRRAGLVIVVMAAVALTGPWLIAAGAQPSQTTQQRLPDTEVSVSGTLKAWLIAPTSSYDHGVLGDAIEAGGFIVEMAGTQRVYLLPPDAVFEDRRVRLADLDGDGTPEAILVKSYLQRGAAIAVYRILPDRIEPLAESAAIGTRNRWLNPVGVADFAGTGEPMIAAVVTPHLAGSLRLYRLRGSTLDVVARIDGYTNHIIGSRDLDLGRTVRLGRDAPHLIVLPTRDRSALAAISFQGSEARVVRVWPVTGHIEGVRIEQGRRARISTTSGVQMIDLGAP